MSTVAGLDGGPVMGRRTFLRLAGAGVLSTGLSLDLAACGLGSSPPATTGSSPATILPMKLIQGSTSLDWAPVQLASAAGYFKQHGVDVAVTYQGSGGTTTNVGAVLNGGVDAGGQVGSALTAVRAGGADIRIIGALTNRIAVQVVMRSDVASRLGVKTSDPIAQRVKSLSGLKIGTLDLGGGVYFALQYALKQQNVDVSKVATVTGISPWEAVVAALQSGRIDAAAFTEPYGEIATSGGKAVLLLSTSRGEFPDLQNQIFTCIYAHNNYASDRARKDLLGRFMNAIAQAQHVIATQPQVAKSHLSSLFSSLPSDVFDAAFKDTGFNPTPVISSAAFDNTHRYQEAVSGKSLPVKFADVIDNTFANAAVANLKGETKK